MQKLNNRQELQLARVAYANAISHEQRRILVCCETGCVSIGSLDVYDRLKQLMEEKNIPVSVELSADPENIGKETVGLKKCACHGICEKGPLIRIEPEGWLYTKVKVSDCEEIIEKTILGGKIIERLLYNMDGKTYERRDDIPFFSKQKMVVRELAGKMDSTSIEEYIANGGYLALEKALFDMTGDEIVNEITESNLRGRGGGGFPTGRKWSQVRRQKEFPKYVVCNGDEGDPGAFMDRSVMEGDPHRMLEGMMIAGRATGAEYGYIYVRAEYPLAVARLRNAIAQAEEAGLLGEHILGSDFNFTIRINCGAGAFVCGEGSALTASIEGKRGMPRTKPPRTVEHGLFDKPTVLNNVETYANVSAIINKGSQWYRSIGKDEASPGTKVFALTGNIANTGLIEVPMGTTLREIIYDIGGGIRGGGNFKAVQIGGPSGGCLTKDDLDLPLDFDSVKKVGAMIGSGGLVVMDDKTCMVEVARFFMNFTQNESCGKCTPCREGTKRMLEILERIVLGKGQEGDVELLLELADTISSAALCGLGKSAPNPVVSTIKKFRNEYDEHIRDKHCATGICSRLKRMVIDPEICRGCSKCARQCPVSAISGELRHPFSIDLNKCIRCGACIETCPFHAIREE